MSSVRVQQALALAPAKRGPALLSIMEDQWFDRKSARVEARQLADLLIAFANAEGGTAVVGLSEGRVEGISAHRKKVNAWRQAPYDFVRPPIRARSQLLDCVNDAGAADQLFVVEVEPSTRVHANAKDMVFLRVGDETRRLSFDQRQELLYEKGQASFESTGVPRAGPDDLDRALLASYAKAVRHRGQIERLMVARGLCTREGAVTVAGLLLFGRHPQEVFPEATVRVLRYRGTERGTGSRQQLLDDVRCEGPIPTMLGDARKRVLDLLPTRRALGSDGRFVRVGIVPRDAWLEAIVNAVVHRSYSVTGDHVRVEIFDDRIEVESPGRFPGLIDLSDPLRITRFARNPRIARVCSDLSFGQELGEGIRRIFEEMRLAGLSDPLYRQTAGTVRLTLSSVPVDRELESRLPEGSRALVRTIREMGVASTGDLAERAGLSRPAALKRLKALQEAGVIEWVGKSRKDPRAFWRIPTAS